MVSDNNQLNNINSSTHHMEFHISPTISSDQSIIIPSFTNITHNKGGTPRTISLELASIVSHYKEIIFLERCVVHIKLFKLGSWLNLGFIGYNESHHLVFFEKSIYYLYPRDY